MRSILLGSMLAVPGAAFALSGCGGASPASIPISGRATLPIPETRTSIAHVILMIQENRTFNDLFATFPGAIGTTTGKMLVLRGSKYVQESVNLTKSNLEMTTNLTHLYTGFLTAYDKGEMDGFSLIKYQRSGQPEGTEPYRYVDPSQIGPYWSIASRWGLAEKMFQTQGSDSFTAHQDLIRGGTFINSKESLIDPPTSPFAWGCDATPGAKTNLITKSLKYLSKQGPFPCSDKFPDYGSNGYQTLRDLLDSNQLSWKYYAPHFQKGQPNGLWNAFDMIAPVRYGPEWKHNISSPETNVLSDIKDGELPAMSWVIPDAQNSDHPGYSKKDTGPSWVASVVNAVGQSKYWDSTVVIVVWDDWGGFYDSVPPSLDDQGGSGFRVPMLVVSPYVKVGNGSKGGYISKTVYQFGSILRFIEDVWGLGRLGTTDSTCKSISDMFDFNQKPRKFTTIPAAYGRSFFFRQKPSGLPVDTE
jgi:phospholipase C